MRLARSAAATMSNIRQLSDDGAVEPDIPSVGGSVTTGTSVSARTLCAGVVVVVPVVVVPVVVVPVVVVPVVVVDVVVELVVDVPVVVVDVVVVVVVVDGMLQPLLKMACPAAVQFRPGKL